MTGGSAGANKVVTVEDINSAKEKISARGKKSAIEEMKNKLSPGTKIFDDAVQFEISNISVSDKAGFSIFFPSTTSLAGRVYSSMTSAGENGALYSNGNSRRKGSPPT